MMLSPNPSSLLASPSPEAPMPLVKAARALMEALPRRGAYLAQTIKDTNLPVLSNVGASLVNYGSGLEFTTFEKIPELGGLTVSKTPKAVLVLALFAFCMGGRIDAAVKRAPVVQQADGGGGGSANGKPKKDLREVRDILIRDFTAMTVFLFGLEVLQDAVRKQFEATGRVVPFGPKNRVPRLSIFQQPSITKAASLIHYQTHLHPYQLHSVNSLLHILERPINRNNVVGVLQQEFASYKGLQENPVWQRLTQRILNHAEQVGIHLNTLDETVQQALQQGATASRLKGSNALPLLRRAFLNTANMETGLLNAPATLLKHLQQEASVLEQQVEGHLQALTHPSASPLSALLLQLKAGWSDEGAQALEAFASNKQGVLNQHLLNHLGFNPKETGLKASAGFKQAFTHHWEGLKTLQELLPQWHAKQQAIALLNHSHSASTLTEVLGKASEQSGLLHNAVSELEEALGNTVLSKKWFNAIKIPGTALQPKNILVKAAQTSRASGDWLALCFILGALGLAPVWLNRVLNDALYSIHLEKQKTVTTPPLASSTSGTTQTATVSGRVVPTSPPAVNPFTTQRSPVSSFQPYRVQPSSVFRPYPSSNNPLAAQPLYTSLSSNPFNTTTAYYATQPSS
jgi:hypothetical protein